MKKKITAMILSAVMVFGILPVSAFMAFAEDDTEATVAAPIEIGATYDWYSAEAEVYTLTSVSDLAGLAKITQNYAVANDNKDETVPVEGIAQDNFAGMTVLLASNLVFTEGQYWYYNDGTTVYDYRINAFAGTFDGGENTITNLTFLHTAGTNQNVGLFSTLAADGAVNNLKIDTVMGTFGKEVRYGTVAATLDGDVDNCDLKNINITVSAGVFRGGALGYSVGNGGGSDISDCSLDGFTVVNNASDGVITYSGLLGTVKAGTTVTGCAVNDITLDAKDQIQNVGGLIGLAKNTTVKECSVSSAAFISGYRLSYTGGLAGQFGTGNGASSVENCTAEDIIISGAVVKRSSGNGEEGTGGFVGAIESGTVVKNCQVSNASVSATEDGNQIGGFIGNVNIGEVIDCSADAVNITISGIGEAVGTGCVGGFAGQTRAGASKLDNCVLTNLNIVVKDNSVIPNIGGFVGNIGTDTTIVSCSASGTIDTSAASLGEEFLVGGFVSNLGWGGACVVEIDDCVAAVDISAVGTAGGFLCITQDMGDGSSLATVTVSGSSATGDVSSASGAAGGFIGMGNRGTFENCSASGTVCGDVAGGFVGTITPNTSTAEEKSLTISDSSASGIVLGGTYASGFAGTVMTVDDNGNNSTSVMVDSSSAAALVAGADANTVIDEFASDITKGESSYTATDITVSGETLKVLDESATLTLNNGSITAPAGTTVQFSDSEPIVTTDGILVSAREFVVTADKETVVIGETVEVSVTLKGTDLVGAEWTLAYDSTRFELVSENKTYAYAAQTGKSTFDASELLATYIFKAIVLEPNGLSARFTVEGADAWTFGEASRGDSVVYSRVTAAEVKTVDPDYEVYVNTSSESGADYVAGKKLVLVYTNSPDISFSYAGTAMYNTSAKYKKEGYEYSFATVVDAVSSDYAENVAIVYSAVTPDYVLTESAVEYDLNNSGEFNLRDVTVVFGVYNGDAFAFENYMKLVLNSDFNSDGVVDGYDTDAYVQAYGSILGAN